MPEYLIEKEDLAWIAGFFDGEGSVGIHFLGGDYRLQVTIGQKHDEVLCWLSSIFGGAVSYPRNRNFANWQLYSNNAYSFLCAIQPYTKCKRTQVDYIINNWQNNCWTEIDAQEVRRMKGVDSFA